MIGKRPLGALFVLVSMGTTLITTTSPAENQPEPTYVPYDVRDAVIALGELLGPEWGRLSGDELRYASRGLLMQVRNMWIHGSGKSPRLKNYFHRKGIYNAELMSSIIWGAYQATINQTHFKLREAITQMASYPTSVNLFTPNEAHPRPEETLNLWRAYLVQKDDQTAIQIFCDESGALRWTYDPDEGWSHVSQHILSPTWRIGGSSDPPALDFATVTSKSLHYN